MAAFVHLTYSAPDGCPSQADLVTAVESRGGHFSQEGAPIHVQSLLVTIEKNADGFSGSLRIQSSEGTSAPREVHEADCAKVVEGLAVVGAMALREPPPSPAPTRLQGSTFPRPDAVPVAGGTLHFDRAYTYSAAAGVALGPLPGTFPRYDFAISVANFVTPPEQKSYLVGPIIQVRWNILGPGTFRVDDFTTRAWGLSGGVSSCSALTYDTGGLVMLACGEFGVGAVHTDTSRPGESSRHKDSGYGTAGLAFDTQYNFGSHLQLGLRVGGQVQLGNIAPERSDHTLLFETPLFGAYAVAGLGFHFP
jgi:hypothetical protein